MDCSWHPGQRKRLQAKTGAQNFYPIVVGILLLLVAAGWWLAPRVYSVAITEHRREYRVVVVKEGDTLWSIAEDHLDHGMDPRQLIYEIRTINHLQSAIVKPGELLRIPVAMRL